ncbi:hypothetical protein ABIE56_001846 [Luteibacter sp. 621]|jgi:hypothetical protein
MLPPEAADVESNAKAMAINSRRATFPFTYSTPGVGRCFVVLSAW